MAKATLGRPARWARRARPGARLGWRGALALALAGCGPPAPAAGPSPAPPAASSTAGVEPAPAASAPRAQRELLAPLSSVLAREPLGDDRCAPPFSNAWSWDTSSKSSEAHAALRRIIWLDPAPADEVPVVAAEHERASLARCIAVGPHRGLNLASWCCRVGADEQTVHPPADATGLVATLAIEHRVVAHQNELVVAVAVVNRSPQPLELDQTVASSPVLLLEVRDRSGRPVPSMPPPTPPAVPVVRPLPPHGGQTVLHRLDIFDPELPPGAYTVQVRGAGIVSGSLTVRVVAATP